MVHNRFPGIRILALTVLTSSLAVSAAWSQTFKTLHSFGNSGDGATPTGAQVFDGHGNLYGATYLGGLVNGCLTEGCGTVYKLKPNSDGSWTESVIYAFNGNDGAYPLASPIFDSQGNLDGTTWGEGYGSQAGFVYQLVPDPSGSWTESILHQFSGPWDGGAPTDLTFDSTGNIYGPADSGGLNDTGMVFSLNRSSGWQESILQVFDAFPSEGGAGPSGAMTFDANESLYGTAFQGGAYNRGVVFQLTKRGSLFWKEKVLYAFTGAFDGDGPAGVTLGPDGSLYGITVAGGAHSGNLTCELGCGTVFKIASNPDGTWTETVLYAFRGGRNDGAAPVQRPTFDRAGNIYGVANHGGKTGGPCTNVGCGAVFKLTPSSGGHWTETILHFFTGGLDGYYPNSSIVIDGVGNLYGAAAYGGSYGAGVAYEITP